MASQQRTKMYEVSEVVIPVSRILSNPERQTLLFSVFNGFDRPMLIVDITAEIDEEIGQKDFVPKIVVSLLPAGFQECLENPVTAFEDAYFEILGTGKIHP